jgi:ribulose kinase
MRGSFVGLTLDSSLADLALKFNVTLEAIALQTRHIVDTLNAKGHSIQEIYISGGQAKNAPLMQLLADVCGIPVILPGLDGGSSVVLGAAMLGRFAAELTAELSSPASDVLQSVGSEDQNLHVDQTRQERAPVLPTQLDQERKSFGAHLWNIMVRIAYRLHSQLPYSPRTNSPPPYAPLSRSSLRAGHISLVRLTRLYLAPPG